MTAKKTYKPQPEQTQIVQQDAAVLQYQESLLQEVDFAPEYAEETETVISEPAIVPASVEEFMEPELPEEVEIATPAAQSDTPEIAETVVPQSLPPLPKVPLPGGSESLQNIPPPPLDAGVPHWGQGYFQCLLFKVAGLEYAAPLEWLNGILEWPDNVTELPKQHDWFVGLARNRDQNVKVVDLAQVLKLDYSSKTVPPLEGRANYIMLIDEGRWGIACDGVADVISLSDQEVKWRQNPRFPWLVGTVAQEMCSLVDMEQLLPILESGFEAIN